MYIYIDGWMDGVCYRVRPVIAIDVNRRPRFGRPIISPPRRQWHCISILDGRPAATRQRPSKKKREERTQKEEEPVDAIDHKPNPPSRHPPPHPTPLPHHPPSPIANQSNQEIQSLWFIRQYSSIFLDMEAAAGDSFSSLPPISGHFSHQVK